MTLGWNHRAGLVACLTGGLATALALSPIEGIGFAVGTGLPAWWLGYLALLGTAQPSGAVDWYPLGRLLAWIAATAALTVLATAMVSSAGDFASFQSRMRRIADLFLQAQLRGPPGAPKPVDDALIEAVAQRFAALAPMFAAQGFTLILTAYLWLGAKVVADLRTPAAALALHSGDADAALGARSCSPARSGSLTRAAALPACSGSRSSARP